MLFFKSFTTILFRSIALLIHQLIPSHCPFERDVLIAKMWTVHIPPLCKLNPFYEALMALRFRADCYLADGH